MGTPFSLETFYVLRPLRPIKTVLPGQLLNRSFRAALTHLLISRSAISTHFMAARMDLLSRFRIARAAHPHWVELRVVALVWVTRESATVLQLSLMFCAMNFALP